jgi:hypothetical protein
MIDSAAAISSAFVDVNAVDSAGHSYVAGRFTDAVDFEPGGPGVEAAGGDSVAYLARYAPDHSLVWVRRMGGTGSGNSSHDDVVERGKDLAVDAAGNVYVTGEFLGRGSFGPITLTATGAGTDVFAAKLNANGDFLWARGWGKAATRAFGQGIAVDPFGDVVSVGFTAGLSPGDAWTASGFEARKYGPGGEPAWVRSWDNAGGTATRVRTDAAGDVYLCGTFGGTIDFDPGAGTKRITGASGCAEGEGFNGYVLKLTASGAFRWVAPFIADVWEVPGSDVRCIDLAVDAAGGAIVGGSYGGRVHLDPSSTIDEPLPNIGDRDSFVAKLTPSGALAWATPLGGARLKSVAVDSSYNIYAAGTFSGAFTPGCGTSPVPADAQHRSFVARLTPSGSVAWAETFGGSAKSIAVAPNGDIHVVGTFTGAIDFEPDPHGSAEWIRPSTITYLLKLKQS